MNKSITPAIYVFRTECGRFCKVGRTRKDPQTRLQQIQGGCPIKLNIVFYHKSEIASEVESSTIKKFSDHKTIGEWFSLSDIQFNDLIKHIKTSVGVENVR